jgi:hypothetical protein
MPPNRPRDLPEYASRAGDPSFPPPYLVDEAGMDIFICDGHEAALAQMIERALNVPTARQYGGRHQLQFKLASTRVGFACIDVQKLRSKPAHGQQVKPGLPSKGVYAHQTEVAVMVQIEDDEGVPYWYLPYVLNDLPTAVTTGREIYGYPKQHATFAADDKPHLHRGRNSLFGPNREWHKCVVSAYDLEFNSKGDEANFTLVPVLEFRKDGGAEASHPVQKSFESPPRPAGPRTDDVEIYPGGSPLTASAATADDRAAESQPVAAGSATRPEVLGDDAGADFLHRIRSDVPYAFLRQFRDPERESFASYQAVVIGRLIPSSKDNLKVVPPGEFSVVVPWTFNLALAEQIFGIAQDPGRAIPKAVVGLLSGENATFDVLRAATLWQFGWDNRTDKKVGGRFERWRQQRLRTRSAGSAS